MWYIPNISCGSVLHTDHIVWMLNRVEEYRVIRLLYAIMRGVSAIGMHKLLPCYFSVASSFANYSDVRWNVWRPSYRYLHLGYIWGRRTDIMYSFGGVPTHPIRVLFFAARCKKRGELYIRRYQGRTYW